MVSNEKLIEDLQEFAEELGHTPTKKEMRECGPWSTDTYDRHFGCWNDALRECNLTINRQMNVSEEKLINILQELAEELGHSPTQREMRKHGPLTDQTYKNHFGTWNDALREANLEKNQDSSVSKEKLIQELQEFAEELGRTPSLREMKESGPRADRTYERRFGSWNDALREANLEIIRKSAEEVAGKGEKSYGQGYTKARKDVFSRDNYNCKVCGNRSHLHCHHITPRKEFDNVSNSNTLDNLITLCRSCHSKYEGRWKEADPDTFAENAQDSKES